MHMKLLPLALAASAMLAGPAFAGGQGQTTYTSYDAPIVVETVRPAQLVVVPGITVNESCCRCGGTARSIAFGVAAGGQVFMTPAEVDHMVIYN